MYVFTPNTLIQSAEVNANFTELNSAISTINAAWSTYTPTVGNVTLGNGTVTARYKQIGKTIHLEILLIFGSTSSVSSTINFSLPVTARSDFVKSESQFGIGSAWLADTGTNMWPASILASDINTIYLRSYNNPSAAGAITSPSANNVNATVPFTKGSTDWIHIGLTYEAA